MERDTSGAFLYRLCIGVVAGIVLALIFNIALFAVVWCLGAALVLFVLGLCTRGAKMFLAALLLASVSLGVVRADWYLQTQAAQSLLPYVGSDREVVGVVVNDPEHRATSVHATVDVQSVDGASARGKLLVLLNPQSSEVQYGDTITLRGSIAKPQPFETGTGHVFDYGSYLEVQGVSALMQHATMVGRESGGISAPSYFQGALFSVKHYFEASIEGSFPQPDSALLEGILLGERRGIPQSLTQAFITSSLVHVVVLSGHNITIVSEAVFRMLAFLPRGLQYGSGAVLMILFAAATGFGATTVRALIMALVALAARYLHRSALALRSLAVAGTAMVLWDPPSVLHDQSFILSMLATFGLIAFAPWVEQKLWRVPNYKHFNMRSILATTIAVEIFVTPALLYFSGTFSLFALPANMLVLPVVPFAMLFGFIAGLVGLLNPTVALLPALAGDLLLKWMLFVAVTIQSLPFATATVGAFSGWVLLVLYIPLTAFAILRYRSAAQ